MKHSDFSCWKLREVRSLKQSISLNSEQKSQALTGVLKERILSSEGTITPGLGWAESCPHFKGQGAVRELCEGESSFNSCFGISGMWAFLWGDRSHIRRRWRPMSCQRSEDEDPE